MTNKPKKAGKCGRSVKPDKGLTVAGGKRPQARKRRANDWTAAKERKFLAALGATCNIERSARQARVGTTTVYRRRERCARFRAGWAQALREGYAKLELTLLERSLNGTVKTRRRPDGSTDETHEYPNAVALSLLRMHRDSAREAEAEHDPEEIEEVRERLARKLRAVRARIARESGDEAGEA